ncbi:unnamed protein product [Urochloa humidicola]
MRESEAQSTPLVQHAPQLGGPCADLQWQGHLLWGRQCIWHWEQYYCCHTEVRGQRKRNPWLGEVSILEVKERAGVMAGQSVVHHIHMKKKDGGSNLEPCDLLINAKSPPSQGMSYCPSILSMQPIIFVFFPFFPAFSLFVCVCVCVVVVVVAAPWLTLWLSRTLGGYHGPKDEWQESLVKEFRMTSYDAMNHLPVKKKKGSSL